VAGGERRRHTADASQSSQRCTPMQPSRTRVMMCVRQLAQETAPLRLRSGLARKAGGRESFPVCVVDVFLVNARNDSSPQRRASYRGGQVHVFGRCDLVKALSRTEKCTSPRTACSSAMTCVRRSKRFAPTAKQWHTPDVFAVVPWCRRGSSHVARGAQGVRNHLRWPDCKWLGE
jgi:hypothetical protein